MEYSALGACSRDECCTFCVCQNGHTETVQCLIEAKAEVNSQDRKEDTPLLLAAVNGHTETVKFLIEAKAEVNSRDRDGHTSLFWLLGMPKQKLIHLTEDRERSAALLASTQ